MAFESAKTSSLRLLILAPSPESPASVPPFRAVLEAITGSKPSDEISSFAGYTSHPPLSLRTKYYSADVSIWCDELPAASKAETQSENTPELLSEVVVTRDGEAENPTEESGSSTLEEWKDQMLSPEAEEVRAVIGGIVLILPVSSLPTSSIPESYIALVEAVHALREAVEDESYGRDIASVVIVQGMSPTVKQDKLLVAAEDFGEVCLSDRGILGWDFVTWDGEAKQEASGDDVRNEYGEKLGIQRVIEVLEGIDWSVASDLEHGEEDLDWLDADEDEDAASSSVPVTNLFSSARFSGLDSELQREMMELKLSMLEEDQEDGDDEEGAPRGSHNPGPPDEDGQVEQLQGLMERVVAIREAGAEMSQAERERFAKREIGRMMREMG